MKSKIVLLVFVLTLVIFAGCAKPKQLPVGENNLLPEAPQEIEIPVNGESQTLQQNATPVTMLAEDGYTIAGTYFQNNPLGKQKNEGIILLHGLDGNKDEWDALADKMHNEGYMVVSIDLRGHGLSSGSVSSFKEEDFQKMSLDVAAAERFLANKGVTNIGIVGASIGANTALNYAALQQANGRVKSIALLSPGLDYRGVKTDESIVTNTVPVLIVASREDEYSAESSRVLFSSATSKKQTKLYPNLGHGTQMLQSREVEAFILDWLRVTVQ